MDLTSPIVLVPVSALIGMLSLAVYVGRKLQVLDQLLELAKVIDEHCTRLARIEERLKMWRDD